MPLHDGHRTTPHTRGRDNPALDAAQHLTALGHHVHYVASNESRCISGHCTKEN
ncbi:hypothetical protein [Streptomyces sp. NPDC006193]|uniref:hypothetical protein n=1 Tax=Streptomyces sp. NPDC006193 TaxID=3155717 RepID=UPI0033B572D0